jgi:hypothetical protein
MPRPIEEMSEKEQRDELQALLKDYKNLTDLDKRRAEILENQLATIDEQRSSIKDLTKDLAKLITEDKKHQELIEQTVRHFSSFNDKAAKLYSVYTNLKNPVTAVYQMIELSAERFIALDNAAEAFRKTTGFLASQTSVVEATISRTSRDLATFGVTAENAGIAAQRIADSFSSTALVTDEIVGHVALMEQNLGVAVEDSTSVMQNFMGIGKMSADVANKTAGAAASLAKAAGVPFAKVMKDVATAGGEVLKLVRGSVDALVKGAVEARRLGLELKDVGAAADKFLDFQTSINSEMEASVLFGKDINFTRARELSYAGDLAGLAKEQSKILKEVGDFRKLDAFQVKALAESMGLSVDQLVKMNAKQEEMNELRRKNPDLAAQYEKDLDVLDKTNESLEEKYKKEIRSRQIASQQTKILNDINQIIAKLAELFLPVVSVVMGILVGLIKVSSILITGIMSPITYLYDAFRYITTEVFDLNKFLSETSNTMSGISAKIGEWVKAITAIGVTLAVVFGREKLRTMILNGIAGPFKIALGFIGKYKEKLKDVAGNVASKIAGGAGSAIPTPTTGAGGATGGGTSKFVEGVKAIDPKMLLSLGVAMVAFAGSVLILAHAAKVFGSPEAQAGFSSMAIAAIGLAVITAALVGLSTLITTASPIIVPAIGIMLGFAAAVGVLSLAAMGFGKAFQMFVEGFERAIEIDLFSLAAGFYVLSGAIAAFGASMAIGGMGSFLGGGMMLQLVALAAISPGLILASDALSSIGATLQMFKDETIVEGIENITEAVKGLNKEINNVSLLNIAGLSTIGTIGKNAAGGGDEVVSKLDELIELMKSGGIAVNIDGSKVSTAVGVATKFRGSF